MVGAVVAADDLAKVHRRSETTMTPSAQQTIDGFLANLDDFTALILSVDVDRWNLQTRCEGWTIAEIAAHVTGSVVDVLEGRVEIRGLDPAVVVARQTA